LELALGLVVFTVVGVGYFINWMIPAMPLSVAFALAAIVSPTDPIAVSAIAARVPIPRRLMHILEGESLLNDASGLVSMRFAIAATLTGAFSLLDAAGTFLWLAIGGVAIGVGVTLTATLAKNWFSRHFGEETGSQILISLLIPFGAYLMAEHLHCFGILAAVAAGITMSYAEQSGQALPVTRVRRQYRMGPDPVHRQQDHLRPARRAASRSSSPALRRWCARPDTQPVWLVVYVAGINLALAVLRFAWVWTSLRFTLFRAALKGQHPFVPSWRLIAATSLAGVRGITLAGVLTLPLTMNDGLRFRRVTSPSSLRPA
jgi:CPA1 family monovalent cation:H+ antiporter